MDEKEMQAVVSEVLKRLVGGTTTAAPAPSEETKKAGEAFARVSGWQTYEPLKVELLVRAFTGSTVELEWNISHAHWHPTRLLRRQAKGAGEFEEIAKLKASDVAFQDKGLELDTAYLYRLELTSDQGPSNGFEVEAHTDKK